MTIEEQILQELQSISQRLDRLEKRQLVQEETEEVQQAVTLARKGPEALREQYNQRRRV